MGLFKRKKKKKGLFKSVGKFVKKHKKAILGVTVGIGAAVLASTGVGAGAAGPLIAKGAKLISKARAAKDKIRSIGAATGIKVDFKSIGAGSSKIKKIRKQLDVKEKPNFGQLVKFIGKNSKNMDKTIDKTFSPTSLGTEKLGLRKLASRISVGVTLTK